MKSETSCKKATDKNQHKATSNAHLMIDSTVRQGPNQKLVPQLSMFSVRNTVEGNMNLAVYTSSGKDKGIYTQQLSVSSFELACTSVTSFIVLLSILTTSYLVGLFKGNSFFSTQRTCNLTKKNILIYTKITISVH